MIFRAWLLLVLLLHIVSVRSTPPGPGDMRMVVENLRLLIGYAGWRDNITNVGAMFETEPGKFFTYSTQDLYNDQVTEANIDAKHFMTATLLGCEYMDVLFKYTRLIMIGLVQCQHLRTQTALSVTPNYQPYLQCYGFVSDHMNRSLEMFDRMAGALNWLKGLHGKHEAYVAEFLYHVQMLRNNSQNEFLLRSPADVNVYNVIVNQQCVMSSLDMAFNRVKEFVQRKNCLLLDNNEIYPYIPPDEILVYISEHMTILQSTVLKNYYDDLGFTVRVDFNRIL